MPKYHGVTLTRTFRTLGDPTRLSVVERLSQGPASVRDLAEPFDMTLPSFMQHLGVLQRGGLVASHKAGRVRTFRLLPDPLVEADAWLEDQRTLWIRRLDQLDDHLINLARTPHEP